MHPLHVRPNDSPVFLAGDHTHLAEVIHPQRHEVPLSYSLAKAWLDPGETSLPHRLSTSSELYYFLAGKGVLTVDALRFKVCEGHAVLVPAGARQFLENTGTERLIFLCIVSPPWQQADEQIESKWS